MATKPGSMSRTVWRLAPPVARLELAGLAARIDLARPQLGLTGIELDGRPLAGQHILGVQLATDPADFDSLIDRYERGTDLVATYAQTDSRPVRVQIYWRAIAGSDGMLPAVEVMVSVQTNLLDCRPELTVRSRLAASELWRLVDRGSSRFERCRIAAREPLHCTPSQGAGCFLMRPHLGVSSAEASYLEMVHPADFRSSLIGMPGENFSTEHRLFGGRLEKGVILRARVRGVFLPRGDDLRLAAQAYAAFADAPPPLTA